jgi:hypothetical protein
VPAPQEYVRWINDHVGFNPRGQGHSDALTAAIIRDLHDSCPPFGAALDSGAIEWRPNVGLTGKRHNSPVLADDDEDGEIEPNIDGVALRAGGLLAPTSNLVPVPLTIENKTIMTAHGKARTNRYNDARAYATHVHAASPDTVAAFTIVINTALKYRNPDAFARNAKVSGTNPAAAAKATIDLFRGMRIRTDPTQKVGWCEAAFILVIDYDGETPTARLVTDPPAPQPGEPFSYEWFLERLCEQFKARNTGQD